jgi:tripartite-type tricarboxylate transporter receptor subunit TctC
VPRKRNLVHKKEQCSAPQNAQEVVMARHVFALIRALCAAGMLAFAHQGTAQSAFPTHSVRLIVPFPPGGGNDILARLLGQRLSEMWGQAVVIDNRPGGNTVIGAELLTKSAPDGYTLMLTNNSHVIMPSLLALPFDVAKDFSPVATVASAELLLVVNPSVPATNLQDFIALARSKPGQINYGSGGIGNPNHLAAELFDQVAGVKMTHIPYKGAQAITDLVGGHVDLHFPPVMAVLGYVKSGQLRALAITGDARSPALPDVPTFAEAGLPQFAIKQWYGVFAPAKTPKPIVNRISGDIAKVLSMPDIKTEFAAQGVDPYYTTPAAFGDLVGADLVKYQQVIRTANIKLDK